MLPFGVTITATVPQRSEIPDRHELPYIIAHLKSKSSFTRYFEALLPEMWHLASYPLQHGPVLWSLTAITRYCLFISLGWQMWVLECRGTLLRVLLLIYPTPVIMAEKENQSVMSPSPLRHTNPLIKERIKSILNSRCLLQYRSLFTYIIDRRRICRHLTFISFSSPSYGRSKASSKSSSPHSAI
jgi:hypothetical protein